MYWVVQCTMYIQKTKRFPEAREMSQGQNPRDISRADGKLEVEGDVQPILPSLARKD